MPCCRGNRTCKGADHLIGCARGACHVGFTTWHVRRARLAGSAGMTWELSSHIWVVKQFELRDSCSCYCTIQCSDAKFRQVFAGINAMTYRVSLITLSDKVFGYSIFIVQSTLLLFRTLVVAIAFDGSYYYFNFNRSFHHQKRRNRPSFNFYFTFDCSIRNLCYQYKWHTTWIIKWSISILGVELLIFITVLPFYLLVKMKIRQLELLN